ncbi:inner nuclear membrane protein Man1 [Petromyzon marinus]|uniref:inner nuclear membrane protein Man1 n=1 Tax=Petromyzon marinus TaxID=7757 RepID=UPI003F6FA771
MAARVRDGVSPRSAVASTRLPARSRLGRRSKDGDGGGGGSGGGGGGFDQRDDDKERESRVQQQQQRHLHPEQQQQQARSVGRPRSRRIGVGFSSDESEGEAIVSHHHHRHHHHHHPVSPFPSIPHPPPPPSPHSPPRYQHSPPSPRTAALNNGLKRDSPRFKAPALPSPNGRGGAKLVPLQPGGAALEHSRGGEGGANGNSSSGSSSGSEGYSASDGEDDEGRNPTGAARLHGDSRRHQHPRHQHHHQKQQHQHHRLQRQQQQQQAVGRGLVKSSPGVADSVVQQNPSEKLCGARYVADGTNGGGTGRGVAVDGVACDGVVAGGHGGGGGGDRATKQGDHHGNCVVRNRQVAGSSETHAPMVTTTTSTSSSSSTTTTTTPDANHSGTNHTRARRGSETERELLRQFKVEEGEAVTRRRAFCAQYLSMLLLLSTALFFLCLAFVYVNIRTASERQGNATSSSACCNHSALDDGPEWQILSKLYDHLATIAGDLDCGDHVHIKSRRISFVDAYAFITSTSPLVNESMFNASLQTIIGSEADLGIRLLGEDTEQEVANLVDVRYLESTHPQRSFICRLRRAFLTVLHKMFIVFAGVGIVLGVLAYMKYRWRKEEEETRNMYDLVERIIDMLRSHSENCVENKSLQPVLPLPHVRDTLIPLQERRRMGRVWRRAVAFIAANESRVRTERQRMAGEDCEVWRWTQAAATAPPPGKLPAKIWQGKAFHLDRRNSPLHSLTPCLKIRNMFDPDMEIGEKWHLSIHDAIMEKCHDNGGIVHIEVDKTSHEGCVYVKCLSPEHAGKAFKSLHGSWFDGKLVTVKYLWLERYHQRFPHAVTSNIPMQPSNRAANAAPSSSPGCQVERHGDKTI